MNVNPSNAAPKVNEIEVAEVSKIEEQTCHSWLGCMLGDTVELLVFLFITGIVGAVLLFTFVHLRRADEVVDEERARTVAERDAFAAFARRVAAMDAQTVQGTPTPRQDGPPLAHRTDGGAGVDAVERAYRETVMDVSHYDREYDEPPVRHLSAEFGTEVGQAVLREDALSPQLQSALVAKARTASQLRDDLLDTVDRESEAIGTAQRKLGDLDARLETMARRPLTDRSYDELLSAWERLDELESEAVDYVDDRQRQIHAEPFNKGRSHEELPDTFQEYVYEPIDVTYPVLADGTRLVEEIRTARRRVHGAIAADVGFSPAATGD